jgi:hypothetical protein
MQQLGNNITNTSCINHVDPACTGIMNNPINQTSALPTISTFDNNKQLAESTLASQEILTDEDVSKNYNNSAENAMQQITKIFTKYQIPIGLLNKLLGISDFKFIEMLIDDSGSMNTNIEYKNSSGNFMTRWNEVHVRIMQMFEILAYVPFPPAYVRFLNRPDIIEIIKQNNETPEMFIQRITHIFNNVFSILPSGSTPARDKIIESLKRCEGESMLRYFFGDGVPDGGLMSVRDITNIIIHRQNPNQNPFTFISCSSNNSDVEWMKECEEVAPYCSEVDDFVTESNEIICDQGKAFPFTYGTYLVFQLVAAFNPDDLDNLDESVPLTKTMLDNMQGYISTDQEYNYYFNEFIKAQCSKQIFTALDKCKKDYLPYWQSNFENFRIVPLANHIPIVQQYRLHILSIKKNYY